VPRSAAGGPPGPCAAPGGRIRVFHHSGWAPGAIDLDEEETAFFAEYRGAVSPDGPDHFPVVAAKLHRMHEEEPTLTVADLAGYPGPTLVMVGDGDDEIPLEHALALRAGLPRAQLAVVPGTGTGCQWTSPTSSSVSSQIS